MRRYNPRLDIDSHPNPTERNKAGLGAIQLFFFVYVPLFLGLIGIRMLMLYYSYPIVELSIMDDKTYQLLDFIQRNFYYAFR